MRGIDLVPVKHVTSYFSPFLFKLNKSRFTNTYTTTGFVSRDIMTESCAPVLLHTNSISFYGNTVAKTGKLFITAN